MRDGNCSEQPVKLLGNDKHQKILDLSRKPLKKNIEKQQTLKFWEKNNQWNKNQPGGIFWNS